MCDIEEFITRHQDIYHSKYSDCLGNMDLYITDSLQDMLDIDIKSEMATDLGSGTDFSDALGLSFSEMPPLLDMDSDNASAWIHSYHNSNSTSFVQNMDLYGGSSEENVVMVNPNSVMPSGFTETPTKKMVNQNASHLMLNSVNSGLVCDSPLPSPKEEKSHLTFSPSTIKVTKVKDEPGSTDDRGGLVEATQMIVINKDLHTVKKDLTTDLIDAKKIKLPTTMSTTPTLRIRSDLRINNKNCSILTPANSKVTGGTTQYVTTQSLGSKTIISGNIHILGAQQSRTILNKNQATILIENSSLNNSRHLLKTNHNTFANILENGAHGKFMNKAFIGEFPKPAYSYSCLIAMALKNSRTGSLPVSEIYNFMCQHFPYFKTAPNGWKNSVRHNLSLNKCFEKIEKPSTNGGQRKGCLWAMNPAKVEKMDEEVQKWSRKDPSAIKKAMVFPDNLEALERGEMKYSSGGVGSDPEMDGDELDTEDADTELDTEIEEELDGPDEQESSEPELDVEDTTLGVGGCYRLLTANAYHDDNSDIEVMEDTTYDEIDIEEHKPEFKLEFALTDDFEEIPAKRAKSSFVYAPVSSAPHASRRKTPLVNRIA